MRVISPSIAPVSTDAMAKRPPERRLSASIWLAEELGAHAPDKVKAALTMTLLCRVEIKSDRVEITLSRCRLTQLLAGSIDLTMQHQGPIAISWLK
jgi:hypothetical protein